MWSRLSTTSEPIVWVVVMRNVRVGTDLSARCDACDAKRMVP